MTALAMKQPGLKPATKIVLYWLADHHNGETGRCHPSIARLAECCEMSRRSVENHLKDLEKAGLVRIKPRRREQGGKTSNDYTLMLIESDTQNLRMGSAKSAHGDTQNLRMKNLGSSNHTPLSPQGGNLKVVKGSRGRRAGVPDGVYEMLGRKRK
jgi:DNA-binding transcriptional ArsR family regulator